jgi:hypothetical protein
MTHAAGSRQSGIGVLVESANANQFTSSESAEEKLSGPIESVAADLPIVHQSLHKLEAFGGRFGTKHFHPGMIRSDGYEVE